MEDQIWEFVTIISVIAATTAGIVNWLHQRFVSFENRLNNQLQIQLVEDTKMGEKYEHLEYLVNANRELIEHRTKRLESWIEHNKELLAERTERIETQLEQRTSKGEHVARLVQTKVRSIENYLAKGEYQIRGDD